MEKLMKQVERMDSEEVDKLRKLLNERSGDEKPETQREGVGWMYKEDRPDNDEYLLGRRIDRHIEGQAEPVEDKTVPGASFSEVIARRADIDMQAKMREDPLYAIRKQEEESRKKLLANPIKMKQLEKLIKEKEQMSRKKDKKKKKKKKRDEDSSDSGDELLDRYLEIRRQKELKALRRDPDMADTNDPIKHGKTHKHHKEAAREKNRRSRSHSQERSDRRRSKSRKLSHSEEDDRLLTGRSYGLVMREGVPVKSRHKSRHSSERQSPPSKSHSRSHSRRSRSRSRSPRRSKSSGVPPRKKEKLSQSEMEKRRQEMLENAQQRDREREKNVRRYKAEADREKDEYEKQGSASDFLNPLLMKHADNASVEERIKRNKYNVQRTRADLDKNFARR